jgi:hypothetical protein
MTVQYAAFLAAWALCCGCGQQSTEPSSRVAPDKQGQEIPRILQDLGFGDPAKPVSIMFVAEFGGMKGLVKLKETDGPPPSNTRWVFSDPQPVWKCFAGARSKGFHEGSYAGADAVTVLTVETKKGKREIAFHGDPGWATVVTPSGREGGDWRVDPVAVRRLARLLSNTPPTELGVPILRGHRCVYVGRQRPEEPVARLIQSEKRWAELQDVVKTWYESLAGEPLEVPEGFQWGKDLAVVVWLPPRERRDYVAYHHARMAGDTLKWDVGLQEKEEKAEGFSPAAIGFFSPPRAPAAVEVWLDGKMVSRLNGNRQRDEQNQNVQ